MCARPVPTSDGATARSAMHCASAMMWQRKVGARASMTAPLGRFRMSLHGEAAAPRAHGLRRARARLFKQGAIACVHIYRILGSMPLRWASARAIVRDVKEVKSRPSSPLGRRLFQTAGLRRTVGECAKDIGYSERARERAFATRII